MNEDARFDMFRCVSWTFQTQRRSENDTENRKKLEQSISDLKRKLEEEQNRRTRDHNNSQAVAEKIANLEKLVRCGTD